MKMFRKDEGFTLIELMVVVLIIGILVAIAIPVFNSARANAQKRSCYANQRTIEGAAHSFEASAGHMPGGTSATPPVYSWDTLVAPNTAESVIPSYIATKPVCPLTAAGSNSYTWDGQRLTCSNADHTHY